MNKITQKNHVEDEQRLIDETIAMGAASVAFGNLELFLKAGYLHNAKQGGLWRGLAPGCKDWDSFLEKCRISTRQDQKYRNVAKKMMQVIAPEESNETILFSIAIIKKHFGHTISGGKLNLDTLSQASLNLQEFRNYLSPDSNDHIPEHVTKLLTSKVKEPTVDKIGEKISKVNAEVKASTNEFRKKAFEEFGVSWDSKQNKYVNADGSELTDEQRTEMSTYDGATLLWDKMDILTNNARKEIREIVTHHGDNYINFAKRANSAFADDIHKRFVHINETLRILTAMANALIEGNRDEAILICDRKVDVMD